MFKIIKLLCFRLTKSSYKAIALKGWAETEDRAKTAPVLNKLRLLPASYMCRQAAVRLLVDLVSHKVCKC